jgi:hypothetical protein
MLLHVVIDHLFEVARIVIPLGLLSTARRSDPLGLARRLRDSRGILMIPQAP